MKGAAEMIEVNRLSRFDDLPDWLEVKDVRAYLGLGRTATYMLIRAGKIPHRKFGRRIRVPRHAIVDFGSEHLPG